MSGNICTFCDIEREFCVHGNPSTKVDDLGSLTQTGPTIEAQFSAIDCAGCGERIQKDESITMTDEGWAHTAEVKRDSGPPPTDTAIFEED